MPQSIRIASIFILCFAAGILLKLYQNHNPSSAELRSSVLSSARASCLERAHQTSLGRTAPPAQVNRFCDCILAKGVNTLSDTELRAAAARGPNPTEADRARIQSVSNLCDTEVFGLK